MSGLDRITGLGGPQGVREVRPDRGGVSGESSFAQVLEGTTLRFSRHAADRLRRREIPLEEGDLKRVERAVEAAERKGAVQSLVLVGDAALIVNLPTRSVISAFHRARLKDGVFTRIDSAVVVDREGDGKE